MTVQPIGPSGVTLFLTPDDLRPYGATPEQLTRALALRLVRLALLQAGLRSEGPMEIEAYHDPCGVLVFAHLAPPSLLVCERTEDLAAALRACPPEGGDEAVFCRGRWWLSLAKLDRRRHLRLLEFGAVAEGPCPTGADTVRLSGAALAQLLELCPGGEF